MVSARCRRRLKQRLFERDGWFGPDPRSGVECWLVRCAFGCGVVLRWELATIDHYPVPKRDGGGLTFENTRLACRGCNSRDGGPAGSVPRTLKAKRRRDAAVVWMFGRFRYVDRNGIPLDRL